MRDREEIEMEVWSRAWCASDSALVSSRTEFANTCLDEFRQAFPVKSSGHPRQLVNHSEDCKGCEDCEYSGESHDNTGARCDFCYHSDPASNTRCRRESK